MAEGEDEVEYDEDGEPIERIPNVDPEPEHNFEFILMLFSTKQSLDWFLSSILSSYPLALLY